MKHIRSWLKFCLLLPCMAVRAQQPLITSEYAYRHYTTQDGLPKMYTECLFQDSKGFIWVGSLNGLVRYNGLAFETFQGVENAEITAMCESASRNLMAFGPESYHIFDYTDEKFIEKTYPDKFYFNELASRLLPAGYAIFNRIDGDRKNKLLCCIANETVEVLLENPALDLMRDNNGALFEPEEAMLYLPCDADSTVKIITMKGEQLLAQHLTRPYSVFRYKGRVYCIAENGIYQLCNNRFEPFIPHHFPVAYSFIKTAEDKNGALIISDMKNVYRLNGDRLEKIFGDANLIIDICIDREGNLWLATYQGVFNLFRQEFKNYILSDRKDMFRVIAGNPDREEIFTGTFDGKLLSVTSNGVQAIAYPSNPEGYFFENYCASTAHSVFLPAAGRVLKVETGKTSWLNLPEQEYRAIAAIPDGNLIAGWEGNFVVFSPYGKLIETLTSEDLLQFCYSRPCFDSQGNLYLGGSKGITRWSRNNPLLLTHPELKPCRILRNDNDGNIWAASRNRLFKLENGRIHPFKELKGEITNIFFTKNNKMLVGTVKNLYIFSEDRKHFVTYNQYNGYTLSEPVRSDMYEDRKGNIWMPAVGGLACFNPDSLMNERPIPLLHLLRFENSTDNIRWNHVSPSDISLQHRQNNIRFHFIGLSFSQVENVRYQYRLTGFQDEWSQPVAERELTFNNLPPGHYLFELKADAGIPGTQTETLSLPVYIRPAFRQTLLFKITAFITFAGVIALLVFRYLKLRHEREILRINRQKEMNELRIQSVRLKSIPHFNSNVLAGIEYFILTKSKEEANELLSIYSRFTNITLHDIDKAHRPLKEELDYVRMYLELEKMRYGNKLVYEIDIANDVKQDIRIPNMVLHTFVENAIKHGIRGKNSGGRVAIRAVAERKGVRLSVEDDGVGRKALMHVERERQGHGLSILTRQIALYNQQNDEAIEEEIVDLKDEYGNPNGTRFELYIPYDYKYI